MTSTQNQAIWELCRQGLHEAAAGAEQRWQDRKRFEPEPRLPLTRQIALLIDRANWAASTTAAPRRAARASHPRRKPVAAAA